MIDHRRQYDGVLKVGQKVYSGLYGGREGVIIKITGEQSPDSIRSLGGGCVMMGGSAMIDVCFEEYISRAIPESIIRGVQWQIYDEILSPSEILVKVCEADLATREKKAAEEKKAKELAEYKATLPAKYPYLQVEQSGVKISSYALGAKNIRTELKRTFPKTKFHVTSKGYSGGCSIDVSWTDGPGVPDVEKIIKKYQEGDFDGMNDIYNFDHDNKFPEVFGGAKYVFAQRDYTRGFIDAMAKEEGCELVFDQYGRYEVRGDNQGSARHWLNKRLHETAA